jgi:hypothetical protein
MKYATTRTFDGQRARVGMIVVMRDKNFELVAAMVVKIDNDYGDERVYVESMERSRSDNDIRLLKFVPTKTEADINALPEGSWTWPVAV